MLELVSTRASIVACFASTRALDAVSAGAATTCRVAPDEAMLVGEATAVDSLVRAVNRLVSDDADALVVDVTDGWAVWTLRGDGSRAAFARLSALELPGEGYVQGDVANVPVRVIARRDVLHLLVPAMWGAYLRERILDRCRAEAPIERPEPATWTANARVAR